MTPSEGTWGLLKTSEAQDISEPPGIQRGFLPRRLFQSGCVYYWGDLVIAPKYMTTHLLRFKRTF